MTNEKRPSIRENLGSSYDPGAASKILGERKAGLVVVAAQPREVVEVVSELVAPVEDPEDAADNDHVADHGAGADS